MHNAHSTLPIAAAAKETLAFRAEFLQEAL